MVEQTPENLKLALEQLVKLSKDNAAKFDIPIFAHFLATVGQISEHAYRRIVELEKTIKNLQPIDRNAKFRDLDETVKKWISERSFYSGMSLHLSPSYPKTPQVYELTERHYDGVEVDYSPIKKIDLESVFYLKKKYGYHDWMDWISKNPAIEQQWKNFTI